MKRSFIFLSFAAFLLHLFLALEVAAVSRGIRMISVVGSERGKRIELYEDYYALVIGVSDYERWPRLPNAVNDAKEVAQRLKSFGFHVKLVLDPTAGQLRTALNEMVYRMGRKENRALLFYYAGHGETEVLADNTRMGYIIPKDCPLLKRDPMGFAAHAVSMREIESVSLRIRAKHVLMLFDSCFSGAIFALVRAVPHAITEKSALPVRQYITAGREDEQVPDKSIFKRCLLIGLEGDADLTGDGFITGSELGMYLSDKVVNYTHRRQHPQYGKINNPDLDRGDFIFVPKKFRRVESGGKEAGEEKGALEEVVKSLQEERRKTEALVAQMRRLLESRLKSEAEIKEALSEKRELKERLHGQTGQVGPAQGEKRAEVVSEMKTQMERKLRALEEKLRKEAARRQALQERLERIRAEKRKTEKARQQGPAKRQKPREAPMGIGKAEGIKGLKILLRDVPREVFESDLEEMITEFNLYDRAINPAGDFANQFVDNGDGTVSDQTTGLMWERGESAEPFYYREAKAYVDKRNRERYLGYDDWRIPTVEELWSLLEPTLNNKGKHIAAVFEGKGAACWSADYEGGPYAKRVYVVDFARGYLGKRTGECDGDVSSNCSLGDEEKAFVRLVRSGTPAGKKSRQEAPVSSRKEEAEKGPTIRLRDTPQEMYHTDVQEMLEKQSFFLKGKNDGGDFPNQFVDNGDGTVTDETTGLMWEQGVSPKRLTYQKARAYVKERNRKKYLGHTDWRMPTLEELCSLLEPRPNDSGAYIAPLFRSGRAPCWTSDYNVGHRTTDYYVVDFARGSIDQFAGSEGFGDLMPTRFYEKCAVKLVRRAR